MDLAREHIIDRLKKEILPLEGLKILPSDVHVEVGIPSLDSAFPNAAFPVGCMHELISDSLENAAAGYGFISFMLAKFMRNGGPAVWISNGQTIFPGGLSSFGIDPQNIVFINLKTQKDILFTLEEALKCDQFSAVIGEVRDIDFKQSRRLQLAAEKSRITGFIFRRGQHSLNSIAAVSRWKISSIPGSTFAEMPGVGYPRWQIELLKIRNGSPGKWIVELRADGIYEVRENIFAIPQQYHSKTG